MSDRARRPHIDERPARSPRPVLVILLVALAASCQTLVPRPATPTRENPYGRADFRDVPVGARAVDFALYDVRGQLHRLSELNQDAIVVLQFASASSPHYVRSLHDVNAVMRDYGRDDVRFVTVYTAEANPGFLPPEERPRTWQERRRLAARLRYAYTYRDDGRRWSVDGTKLPNFPNRITLVDEMPDVVAGIYGYDPKQADNPCFIIDSQGTIRATAPQTTTDFLRTHLERLAGPPAVMTTD